jgi:Transposase DDE domain group 1
MNFLLGAVTSAGWRPVRHPPPARAIAATVVQEAPTRNINPRVAQRLGPSRLPFARDLGAHDLLGCRSQGRAQPGLPRYEIAVANVGTCCERARSSHDQKAETQGRVCRKKITVDFNGGTQSSNGGRLLLREKEHTLGVCWRFANTMKDRRDPNRIRHEMFEMVMARVSAIACG